MEEEIEDERAEDKKVKQPPQTASGSSSSSFIHKLYSMLEDPELKHLIWWQPNMTSFAVSPTEEFARVLSNYFKHTNTASFIRQLNMYGFHKVNDSNSGAPTEDGLRSRKNSNSSNGSGPTVWEFRHSSGLFKYGNLDGLKLIKRRSFKNAPTQKEVHNLKTPQEYEVQSYTPQRFIPVSLSDYEADPSDESYIKSRHGSLPHHITTQQPQQPQPIQHPPYPQEDLTHMYVELNTRLKGLKREHDVLQYKYDLAHEELKRTNYDLVTMLDLLKDSLGQPQQPEDPQRSRTPVMDSPSKQRRVLNLDRELDRFKSSILQRTALRDMELRQVGGQYVPSHEAPFFSTSNLFSNRRSLTSNPDIEYEQPKSRNPSVFDPLQPAPQNKFPPSPGPMGYPQPPPPPPIRSPQPIPVWDQQQHRPSVNPPPHMMQRQYVSSPGEQPQAQLEPPTGPMPYYASTQPQHQRVLQRVVSPPPSLQQQQTNSNNSVMTVDSLRSNTDTTSPTNPQRAPTPEKRSYSINNPPRSVPDPSPLSTPATANGAPQKGLPSVQSLVHSPAAENWPAQQQPPPSLLQHQQPSQYFSSNQHASVAPTTSHLLPHVRQASNSPVPKPIKQSGSSASVYSLLNKRATDETPETDPFEGAPLKKSKPA